MLTTVWGIIFGLSWILNAVWDLAVCKTFCFTTLVLAVIWGIVFILILTTQKHEDLDERIYDDGGDVCILIAPALIGIVFALILGACTVVCYIIGAPDPYRLYAFTLGALALWGDLQR